MATIPASIDPQRCTGCGLCASICPDRAISVRNGVAHADGPRCLACGHCLAVCPVNAVSVDGISEPCYHSFSADNRWLPYGEGDTVQLVRLMLSRRSCRRFLEREIPKSMLEDLVAVATTAPSGTNSQSWTFTILPNRAAVERLGTEVAESFRRLNRLSSNPFLRSLLRLLGRPALSDYHRRYEKTIAQGLTEWDNHRIDRLFHGATAAVVIGSRPGGSCPGDDALLATQNLLLASHTMGFGSCLIGFAVAAMKREPAIKKILGIPMDETIHAVIALGYPGIAFQRLTGRKPAKPRFFHV
ncbi:MAG: nitroreductase family protein [Thermodesulfobacteriota bacterium]